MSCFDIDHLLRLFPDRRKFLKTSLAFAAGSALFGSAPWLLEAQTGSSIATQIGTSVANAFGKQVGTLAFGSFLTAIGVETDSSQTAAILSQLNAIKSQLDALDSEVQAIRTEIEVGFAEAAYTNAVSLVIGLVTQTRHLTNVFADLIALSPAPTDTPAQKAAKLQQIAPLKAHINELFHEVGYFAGLDTWNVAMTGIAQSNISLIKTWSKLVYVKATGYYGPKQAQKIQKLWNYFDGQQALMASYLIDYYQSAGIPITARSTLARWYSNRAQQLALLRGQANSEDRFQVNDGSGNVTTKVTPLNNALPPNVIITKPANDVLIDWAAGMWFLKLPGQNGNPDGMILQMQQYVSAAITDTNTSGWARRTFQTSWRQPTNAAIVMLGNAIGADIVAADGHINHFKQAMLENGFVFMPPQNRPVIDPVSLLSGEGIFEQELGTYRAGTYNYIFREGQEWMHLPVPGYLDDRRAYMATRPFMLLVRGTFPKSQGEYYWWGFDS
jgi:hypothetical protein